ncbi:MAG TPA: M20/M25/M40 family metallo-hydrolase, partial [Pirellulales bacterium]|nr:M20/M25/M40 family metallo-hydrolase [Pirellulales bacterium]
MLATGLAAEKAANSTADGQADSAAVESESRLGAAVRYLASDELEGRGVGTHGIDLAADYIAAQFEKLKLNTRLYDGTPFQKFKMTVDTELGSPNQVALAGPDKSGAAKTVAWKLGADFNPLAIGGSGKFDLPLVYAGYGITDKDNHYDDYAGINVEGKAVILMRHEPEQANPHSVFNGTKNSPLAPFTRKLSNAYEHGAAAVVFFTDEYEIEQNVTRRRKLWQQAIDELDEAAGKFKQIEHPSLEQVARQRKLIDELAAVVREQGVKLAAEFDPLLPFKGAGFGGEPGRIPTVFCRREALEPAIRAALGSDLNTLEHEIDQGPRPHSAELPGWRLSGQITINRREAEVRNVVGVLEGEGPHADETIVIGAHYDHLGWGGQGSVTPDKKEIHNGADDNASGTAALIEVARRLSSLGKRLPRRVVFLAFTGEERGLLGSAYYCRHPLFPLDRTVAMLNMDMVGRLSDAKLTVQGADTAKEFGDVLDRANADKGFKITRQEGGLGPSDHASFYGHKIPVMHVFTGLHKDYHRPSDDFEKINVPGMRQVAQLVGDMAISLAEADSRPTYQKSKQGERMGGGGGDRPYFGSVPDFAPTEPGYGISDVAEGGPADKAGLKGGDIIIKLGESRIGNLEDFDSALRKHKGGDKVPVIVRRAGKE